MIHPPFISCQLSNVDGGFLKISWPMMALNTTLASSIVTSAVALVLGRVVGRPSITIGPSSLPIAIGGGALIDIVLPSSICSSLQSMALCFTTRTLVGYSSPKSECFMWINLKFGIKTPPWSWRPWQSLLSRVPSPQSPIPIEVPCFAPSAPQ